MQEEDEELRRQQELQQEEEEEVRRQHKLQQTESPGFVDPNVARQFASTTVNSLFTSLGLSPAATSSAAKLSTERRSAFATSKLREMAAAVSDRLSSSLGAPVGVPIQQQQCEDCLSLTDELIKKFKESTSFSERKRLLTLLPESLSIDHITKTFNCSTYLVKESRKLRQEIGILPDLLKKKAGNKIFLDVEQMVIAFYEENARCCAGAREYVTIIGPDGKKEKKQRMLLVDTVEELHFVFCQENPSAKIGMFSTLVLLFCC